MSGRIHRRQGKPLVSRVYDQTNQDLAPSETSPNLVKPEKLTHSHSPERVAAGGSPVDTGASPLSLDGWLEFNQAKWNVTPYRFRQGELNGGRPCIESVLYLDRRGRVYHPPRNPYMPVRFKSTPATLRHRLTHQWLTLSEMLVAEIRQRGLHNTYNLPPTVTDVRAWLWDGFQVGVKYTLFIDLPFQIEFADKAIKRAARKAERTGYRSVRTTDMNAVQACLAETEQRQGFSYGLSLKDLELAALLLGEEHFRAYVTFAPNGEPASASVILHRPDAPAILWIRGTRTAHLRDGAAQLNEFFIIDDLEAHGATGYDLAGANIPNIAVSKATWGARLQPYHNVEAYSGQRLTKWALNWWNFVKRGRSR